MIYLAQNSNIRRIDDLGRIVIPKDIRKKLHIKESEPLEIFIDGEEIKIKKYSSLPDIVKYIEMLLDTGSRVTGKRYVVTDRSKIIASTDQNLLNRVLDKKMEELVTTCTEMKNEFLELSSSMKIRANVLPIIVDNDRTGLIIEYSDQSELKSCEIVEIFKRLIENQLNSY